MGTVTNIAVAAARAPRRIRPRDLVVFWWAEKQEDGEVLAITDTRVLIRNWLYGDVWLEINEYRRLEKYGRTKVGRLLDWIRGRF